MLAGDVWEGCKAERIGGWAESPLWGTAHGLDCDGVTAMAPCFKPAGRHGRFVWDSSTHAIVDLCSKHVRFAASRRQHDCRSTTRLRTVRSRGTAPQPGHASPSQRHIHHSHCQCHVFPSVTGDPGGCHELLSAHGRGDQIHDADPLDATPAHLPHGQSRHGGVVRIGEEYVRVDVGGVPLGAAQQVALLPGRVTQSEGSDYG